MSAGKSVGEIITEVTNNTLKNLEYTSIVIMVFMLFGVVVNIIKPHLI